MSRKTSIRAGRGVATLAGAAVTISALGAVFIGVSTAADGDVITVTSATVTNPVVTRSAPTIPAAGPYDGSGTAVTVTGTKFPATPTVTIGGVAATKVIRLSDTTLVVDPPAAASALTADDKVDVVVDGPDNETAGTLTDGYEWKAAPTLSDARYSADFKSVIVTGTNLQTTTDLVLGPLPIKVRAADITNEGKTVTVKVPSKAVKATYSITANTLWGSAKLDSDWNVRPVASKIVAATSTASIAGGDSKGGEFVRITGKSLTKVTKVTFGTAEATNFIASSASEILVQVPAMSATQTVTMNLAKVDVHVYASDLKSATGPKYTYKTAPAISSWSDSTPATNTTVIATGENLVGSKIWFGSDTAKGSKSLSALTGATATSASFKTPTSAATGFVLGQAYVIWVETKAGVVKTGTTLTVG